MSNQEVIFILFYLQGVSSKPYGKMIVVQFVLFLELGTSDLHHRLGFDQILWFFYLDNINYVSAQL